jgi:hypothetical protein
MVVSLMRTVLRPDWNQVPLQASGSWQLDPEQEKRKTRNGMKFSEFFKMLTRQGPGEKG